MSQVKADLKALGERTYSLKRLTEQRETLYLRITGISYKNITQKQPDRRDAWRNI